MKYQSVAIPALFAAIAVLWAILICNDYDIGTEIYLFPGITIINIAEKAGLKVIPEPDKKLDFANTVIFVSITGSYCAFVLSSIVWMGVIPVLLFVICAWKKRKPHRLV